VCDKGLCDLAGAAFVTSCTLAQRGKRSSSSSSSARTQSANRSTLSLLSWPIGQRESKRQIAIDCVAAQRASCCPAHYTFPVLQYASSLCKYGGASHASIHSHATKEPLNGDISRSRNYFQLHLYSMPSANKIAPICFADKK
jgi:hypothetical protein